MNLEAIELRDGLQKEYEKARQKAKYVDMDDNEFTLLKLAINELVWERGPESMTLGDAEEMATSIMHLFIDAHEKHFEKKEDVKALEQKLINKTGGSIGPSEHFLNQQ